MSEKRKTSVINIDKKAHTIISDFCAMKGLSIGKWAEDVLMEEIHRVFSKKGKRKEPMHAQA